MAQKRLSLLVLFPLVGLLVHGCAHNQVAEEGSAAGGKPGTAMEAGRQPEGGDVSGARQGAGSSGAASESGAGRPGGIPPNSAALEEAKVAPRSGTGMGGSTTPGLAAIHFDFDRSALTPEARDILSRDASHLKARPTAKIRIEGHCDERGTAEYNLALGERRARSAHQYLTDLGISPERMTTVTYGKEMPVDPRHSEEAWAKNRRAEFVETTN